MLTVIIMSVIMLSVVMMSVIMPNVECPDGSGFAASQVTASSLSLLSQCFSLCPATDISLMDWLTMYTHLISNMFVCDIYTHQAESQSIV
jgi:hypothetical protein